MFVTARDNAPGRRRRGGSILLVVSAFHVTFLLNADNIHFYYQLAMLTHGIRRGGSAAIDLAYTACGRLEAFWEFGLNPWDMAAGILLGVVGGVLVGAAGALLGRRAARL